MPTDNTTRHTRIGMFCILKPLLKCKSNIRKFSAYFTLIFILDIILFYFNIVFSFFSCIAIKKSTSYLRLLKKLPTIFLLLCLPNLLLSGGDIEKKSWSKVFNIKILSLEFKRSHSSRFY